MSCFIFLTTSVYATWQRVQQCNATVNASFFFNEQRGFIAIDGQNGIQRTSDGGKTWIDCSIPQGYGGFFTDMFMRDSLNGWVTIEEFGNNFAPGLWKTTDGGVTWQVSRLQGLITGVYQTPSAIVCTDRYTINRLSISTDGGVNFSKVAQGQFNGVNFADDIHGVASVYKGTAQYTSDGGLTWQPTNVVTIEAWGVYAQKGSSNFVIVGEKPAADPFLTENVYSSNDYGATWQIASVLPGRTSGHVAGVGPVIYTQSLTTWQYANSISGMYRSTDGGKTWVGVSGPSSFRDTRFSVTGCLGGVVYAFDETGGVWKTTDGGDGQIHEPPHNPDLTPDHIDLASTLCSSDSARITYINLSCNQLKIESIGFIDSTDPVVVTGALSFTRYPLLPQTLNPTSTDYLSFGWAPKKLGVQKPLSTTYVKLHCSMLGGSLSFDTLFAINSQSFANQPIFSLSTSDVKFDSMDICRRFVDTTVTFTNGSCDTLWLDSTLLTASTDWKLLDRATLTPLAVPIGLAPRESASFVIQCIPSGVGAQKADLLLHFMHQGITRDTTLSFTVSCFRTMNVQADDKVDFSSVSICAVRDSVIAFTNNNCDTLTLDGLTNNNSGAFSDISGITFPYLLPPGATVFYRMEYNGVKNVTSHALIVFHYHIAEDTAIWETQLQGRGVPGASSFETSPSTVQLLFNDRTACSPQDSIVFTILNPGCDSMTVVRSFLSGAGLSGISYRTEPPLPVILSDNSNSVRVIIYLQADKPSSNDGTLTFSYQLSDGSLHDSIFTIHALVTRGERIASVSENTVDLGSGQLCTNRDTTVVILNSGCPAITIQNISLSGNYFVLTNPKPTPYDIQPGGTDTVHLSYLPTSSGTDIGQLIILTNADLNPTRIVPLVASTNQIDHLTFKLVQQNSGIRAGDTAIFAVIPDTDWIGKGLRNIDFSISTNGNLLTCNSNHIWQADRSFQTIVTSASLPGNQSVLNVQLTSPTEVALHKDLPLVQFYYATALTDTISTPVTFSLLSLNNGDSNYLKCNLSPASLDGDFVLSLECGSKTLLDFLHGKMPIEGGDVHPNPVTSHTNYKATLPFTVSISGTAEVEYYDALGKKVGGEIIIADKPGVYNAHFDGSQISGGSYEFLIKFRESPLNSVHGRIVVLK